MNIIKQLIDSDGNNIYPIAYAQGGMKLDLKFDNSGHGATYSGTTVNVDLSEYEYLLFEFDYYQTGSLKGFVIGAVGTQTRMFYVTDNSTTNANVNYRNVTISSSSLVFGNGTKGNGTSDNNFCIPYKVYGIKLAWIVPTTVQGLQYIEV